MLLHPAPTCADAGPDLCTLDPDLCTLHPDLCTLHPVLCTLHLRWLSLAATYVVVCLPQQLAQILHLHRWWFHPLQLALVVFILLPTGADTVLALEQISYLHSSNLHCAVVVVVVFWWWWWWLLYYYCSELLLSESAIRYAAILN